jgi:hypothetical protein
MFQYFDIRVSKQIFLENWLDRVNKYKSDPTALLKSRSLLISSKTWYVLLSCTRESWKIEFKNTH